MASKNPSTHAQSLHQQAKRTLEAAKKRLTAALMERAGAQAQITLLDIEIPALETTIRALTAQLNPGSNPLPSPMRIAPNAAPAVFAPPPPFSPDKRGSLRMETSDAMGSILTSGLAPAGAAEEIVEDVNTPPDLDSLPQFGGEFA